MNKQLKLFPEEELPVWVNEVPFVSEVETFNRTFGKPNNYEPTIPEKKEWQFVYDFVLEELEEYRQSPWLPFQCYKTSTYCFLVLLDMLAISYP